MTNPRREWHLDRVVVNPGILVSAFITRNGDSATSRLLHAWLERRFVPVTSAKLLGELRDVLHRPKFRRYITTDKQVDQYIDLLKQTSLIVQEATSPLEIPTPDPDDDYLVLLALSSRAKYLISGDAHLTTYTGAPVEILSARQFLERLEHRDT